MSLLLGESNKLCPCYWIVENREEEIREEEEEDKGQGEKSREKRKEIEEEWESRCMRDEGGGSGPLCTLRKKRREQILFIFFS